MGTSILDEASGRVGIAPLSVEQYEAMIAQGILPEGAPIELLDGLLVHKDRAARGMSPMTVGDGQYSRKRIVKGRAQVSISVGEGSIRVPARDLLP